MPNQHLKVEWPPISRPTDPLTSHEAEAVITDRGSRRSHCDEIYALVKDNPGLTAGEIGILTEGMDGYWKRLSDLKNDGLIRQDQPRVWDGSGRKQVTWWPIIEPVQGKLI